MKISTLDILLIFSVIFLIIMLIRGFRFPKQNNISNFCIRTSDPYEVELINDYRRGYRFICWSIGDFEQQAQEIEDYENEGNKIYDRSKFQETLELMIHKHDAELGINWNTIKDYLDNYCKLENE